MTGKHSDMPPPRNVIKLIIIIVCFVLTAWLLNWLLLFRIGYNPSERGQFGDMFGAVNALFSGLALAGVTVAILLQKDELALQRKELRDTREEMERSTKAQDESQRALNKQVDVQILSARIGVLTASVNAYTSLIAEHQMALDKGFQLSASPFEKNRRDAVLELEDLLAKLKQVATI